jgi:hypothetical protein
MFSRWVRMVHVVAIVGNICQVVANFAFEALWALVGPTACLVVQWVSATEVETVYPGAEFTTITFTTGFI